MTDSTEGAPLKKTPLFADHERLGGKLVPFAGYAMPLQFAGIVKEHTAVRTAAGIFDVSHMGELRVRGNGALALVDRLVTNDLTRIAVGQAMYTCCCNEAGGILDDLIVYKHADDDILTVCNASNRSKIDAHFRKAAASAGVQYRDESDETALLSVQGPNALAIVEALDPSLRDLSRTLGSFRFRDVALAGAKVTVARTGYTGEDGVEIFTKSADAPALYRALLEVGAPLGLLPIGLGARDTLRLEARLSLYGNELSEETNPIEAGLAWTVKLAAGDFVGKSALERVTREGTSRIIVGIEMTGRGVARSGYPILDASGSPIGVVTSGCPSPTLGRSIALGYVGVAHKAIGTELLVDCRGKSVEARVVTTPFYKRAPR